MIENKEIIERYLKLNLKIQFNQDVDLKDEYIFTQNLVSKKTIIAPTFSDKILSNTQLRLYLSAMIMEISNGEVSVEKIKERLHRIENMIFHEKRVV